MDSAVLSLTCAGLGAAQEDEDGAVFGYAKSEHCLDNLKDLQRFLRRDDPQRREVFKQVCKWKIASRDLVPIIENYQTDRNLLITAVKVLVFLTMPVEHSSEDVAQQIEYLWDLKAALTRNVTMTVIVSLLEDPLDRLERTSFTEDDWKLVQLVLTLFRNVLAIQEITLSQKASGEATHLLFLADSFLELMFQENVMDLILVLTQHIDEPSGYLKEENLLLMEIYHYLFLGRDPGLIAQASNKGSKEQVNGGIDSSVDSLRLMMEEEERKKRMFRQRNSEHNSLSGTFTCFSVDGSKSLCKGNPSSAAANSLLKIRNVQKGPRKRIAWDNELLYIPKEGITEMLRRFLDQFLSGAYNILMQSVCDDIMNEHHSIEKSDISTFFIVARFVLAFQHEKASNDQSHSYLVPDFYLPLDYTILKLQKSVKGIQPSEVSPSNGHDDNLPFHGDICGPVAATLNEDMFNIVISRWREAYESLKETNDYKTLSAAGSLMKTMIDMIYLVLKVLPEDSRESQTARVLLYKLFYDQTEQGLTQFLLNLFRSFDSHKQPKSDLADLLETIHIMLQLMEKLQARGALRVAKRTKKGRRKKERNGKNEISEPKAEYVEPNCADPTDRTKSPPESVPDLRVEDPAVEPSPSEQGQVNTSGAHVPGTLVDTAANMESTANAEGNPSCTNSVMKTNLIDEEGETSDSSTADHQPATSEVDFNVSRLISSLANNSVVQNVCWLLKHYKSNSYRTNHYIICMLRRFCEDLELSPMLYQLSLLTTFYDILAEQKLSSSKEYTNIVNFLSKVVRKMLKAMRKQPLLFVDILFWKTRKECHCIDADALLNELKNDVGNKNGEVGSSKGWRGPINIADSLGDDEADLVIPQAPYDADKDGDLSAGEHGDDFRKSSTTYKRSRLMSLSDSEAEENERNHVSRGSLNSEVPKRRGRSIFTEEQEKLIRDLYEKYKDDRKCSHLIAEALDSTGKISSTQVSRKLTQLGLRNAMKRKKVADGSLSSGDLATESQNGSLDDLNHTLSEHNTDSKLKSSRTRRKRLHGSSRGHDDTTHGRSSDEETLQVLKSRAKNKKLPLVDSSLSASQHQEAQQDPDSDDATIGSMIRSGKKKRSSTSEFEGNVQNYQESSKNRNTKDSSPSILQHKKTMEDNYPDDETIGSMLRSGKKKRLVASNFSANVRDQESLRNIDLHDETIPSNIMDASLIHEPDSVANSGNTVEAELLDDFDVELDNHENIDQRTTDDVNVTGSGDPSNSEAINQRAGLKRRHRLVIDDDDDE